MLPACGMQSTCSYSSFHGSGRSREIYCAENKRISAETIAQTWAQISSHISSFPFPFLLLASPLSLVCFLEKWSFLLLLLLCPSRYIQYMSFFFLACPLSGAKSGLQIDDWRLGRGTPMPCQGFQLVGATRHSFGGTVAERHARVRIPASCSSNSPWSGPAKASYLLSGCSSQCYYWQILCIIIGYTTATARKSSVLLQALPASSMLTARYRDQSFPPFSKPSLGKGKGNCHQIWIPGRLP